MSSITSFTSFIHIFISYKITFKPKFTEYFVKLSSSKYGKIDIKLKFKVWKTYTRKYVLSCNAMFCVLLKYVKICNQQHTKEESTQSKLLIFEETELKRNMI